MPSDPRRAEPLLNVLGVALVLLWTLGPVVDFDVWFDVRLGRDILGTWNIPRSLDYLASPDGTVTVNDQWLFCVGAALVHDTFGPAGLAVGLSLALAALCGTVVLGCRAAGLPLYLAWPLVLLGALVMSPRFMPRPQLVTDLGLALLVLGLVRAEKQEAKLQPLAVLCLVAVWANCHAGVLTAPVLLGLWCVGEVIQARVSPGPGVPVRTLLLALGAALLGTMLRPGGVLLYPFVLEHFDRSVLLSWNVEWQPMPADWWRSPFAALLLLVVLAFGRAGLAGRLRVPHLLVVGAFTFLAFRSARAVGEWVPVTLPLLSATLVVAAQGLSPAAKDRLTALQAPARALVGVGLMALLILQAVDFPRSLAPSRDVLPIGAAEFLQRHPVGGGLFNSYHFGGYLVYREVPSIFIHGMWPWYRDARMEDYLAMLQDPSRRPQLIDRYGLQGFLLHHSGDAHSSLAEWLWRSPDWHLTWWDDVSVLFVRSPALGQEPYRAVAPTMLDPFPTGDLAAARVELARRLEQPPESALAWGLLSELELREGRHDEALEASERALAVNPEDAPALVRRGMALEALQRRAEAMDSLERAVRANPRSATALYNLAVLHLRTAQAGAPDAQVHVEAGRRALEEALRVSPGFPPAAELLERLRG